MIYVGIYCRRVINKERAKEKKHGLEMAMYLEI